MKRWIALAACVMTAAACQDDPTPVSPAAGAGAPAELLGISPTVTIDPVLTTLLNLAAPTDALEVLVTYDETLTSGDVVAGALTASGAGIIRFRNLPIVFAVATPAQVATASRLVGVQSLYANKQLTYHLAESVRSIRGDLVHQSGYTGAGVGIAILDSGVDGAYSPDLQFPARTVANVKMIADAGDLVTFGPGVPATGGALFVENLATSETSSGHGTHVAGIAAGDGTGSAAKYTGVAPGANLVGVGVGDVIFVFWALAGFDYILDHQDEYNIQVVNNSWGSTGEFDPLDPVNVATRELYDRGIAVVFAAGNEGPGENTLNPYSVAPWAISVAAVCKTVTPDPTNSAAQCADGASIVADFSSRGRPGDPLYHPDIAAPGVNIVSARSAFGPTMSGTAVLSDALDCAIATEVVAYYTCIGGTSMSAPHVAGVIALMEEASRGRLTPDQAYRQLTRTARPLTGYGEWEVGAGYLDADAAVRAVRR